MDGEKRKTPPLTFLWHRHLQRFGMLLDKAVDMADALFLKDLVDSDKDTALLNITKLIVDGSAKELHRRTQIHVGIDQRRDIVAQLPNLMIENAVVGFEVIFAEDLAQLVLRRVDYLTSGFLSSIPK